MCAGERQRESEEGDVGRGGQTRDVGWVRGFTRAHAANVSAVLNAVQQSGAQAFPLSVSCDVCVLGLYAFCWVPAYEHHSFFSDAKCVPIIIIIILSLI